MKLFFKFVPKFIGLAGLVFALGNGAQTFLMAADGTSGGSVDLSLSGGLPSDPPLTFRAHQAATLSNFKSCSYGNVLRNITDSVSIEAVSNRCGLGTYSNVAASVAAAFDTQVSCPAGGRISPLSCTDVVRGGEFDPDAFDRFLETEGQKCMAHFCTKGRLDAIDNKLQCLSDQADRLKNALPSFQKSYVDNIQRWQKDVTRIKQLQETRAEQINEVASILQGDGRVGRGGLLQNRIRMEELLNQIPQDMQQYKTAVEDLARKKRTFRQLEREEVAKKARECFATSQNQNFRCTANGPALTAKEYLLCRFEQEAQRQDDGNVKKRDRSVEERARSSSFRARQRLASLLDRILGMEEDFAVKNFDFISIAQVSQRFGGQLRSFDAMSSLDVHGFVFGTLGKCYKLADKYVRQQRSRETENNPIGRAQFEIRQAENDVKRLGQQRLNAYVREYQESLRALTGNFDPISTSACDQGSVNRQYNCAQDLAEGIKGLVRGTTPQSGARILIKGSYPQSEFTVQCSGLTGCVTTLQNVTSNLRTDEQRIMKLKQSYVQQALHSAENFTQEAASLISADSKYLAQELEQMDRELASMGLPPLKVGSYSRQEFATDADGLPKVPQDVLAFIGGRAVPPLPNVGTSSIEGSLVRLKNEKDRTDRDFQRAADDMKEIKNKASECAADLLADQAGELESILRNIKEAKCGQKKENCQAGSTLASLTDSVGDAVRDLRTAQGVGRTRLSGRMLASLQTGSNVCQGEEYYDKRAELEEIVEVGGEPKSTPLAEAQIKAQQARRQAERSRALVRRAQERVDQLVKARGAIIQACAARRSVEKTEEAIDGLNPSDPAFLSRKVTLDQQLNAANQNYTAALGQLSLGSVDEAKDDCSGMKPDSTVEKELQVLNGSDSQEGSLAYLRSQVGVALAAQDTADAEKVRLEAIQGRRAQQVGEVTYVDDAQCDALAQQAQAKSLDIADSARNLSSSQEAR